VNGPAGGTGWGYDNLSGLGTITSWKNGDLNRDGKTDVSDFLLLRGALKGNIASSVMNALFGDAWPEASSQVPEPGSLLLAGAAAGWLVFLGRRPPRCRP
jgi:hypothetical protein